MTGFYGKLPVRGDFLSRGLPREFVDSWDAWLQRGMLEIRETLQDAWLETYLTSPLWRFLVPPGVISSSAWIGVFMPSVDKVGRYFPMTIARELIEDVHPLLLVGDCDSWFAAMEESLLAALDDEALDLEDFESALKAVPLELPDLPPTVSPQTVDCGTRFALGADASAARLFLKLSISAMEGLLPCCVWWGHGSELVPPSLMLSRDLPDRGRFTAMIDGQWSSRGWLEAGDDTSGIAPTVVDLADL